jgi:hypothetical protein
MRLGLALSLFAAILLSGGTIFGGTVPITIQNYSFESPTCGTPPAGCLSGTTDWVEVGGANAYAPVLPPGSSPAWDSLPNGTQVATINDGSMSQVLAATATANTTYTLSVWVSERWNSGLSFQPTIELLAGSTPIITMNLSNPGGALPTTNADGTYNWVDWTMSFTTPNSAAYLGLPLEIFLSSPGPQADFDDISLDQTVPEPTVLTLVGAGLLGLVARRRFAR